MNIDDILAAFGFGSQSSKRRPDELDMFFRRRASPPTFFDDEILLDRSFDHVFHEMDQMMRGLDEAFVGGHRHSDRHSPALNIPIYPSIGHDDQGIEPSRKHSNVDADYDDIVSKYGLDSALDKVRQEQELVPRAQSRSGFFGLQKQMRVENFGDGVSLFWFYLVSSDCVIRKCVRTRLVQSGFSHSNIYSLSLLILALFYF